MQVGTPSEVYSRPQNTHVATFLGTTNLWEAEVLSADPGGLCCRIGDVEIWPGCRPGRSRTGSVAAKKAAAGTPFQAFISGT